MAQSVWNAKAELTTHTPSNTTLEQWGTEEATVALSGLPAGNVTVVAHLTGRCKPNVTTAGVRGFAKVEVSLDGGTSWDDGWTGALDPIVTQSSMGVNGRVPIGDQCMVVGTPTGDVQARAMCADLTTVGDWTFEGGRIILEVYRGN